MVRKALLLVPALWLACSTDTGSAVQDHTAQGGQRPNEVVVDTGDDLAWAQHQANLAFATSYQPTCTGGEGGAGGDGGAGGAETEARPRVLVTGFGRFGAQRINATGLVVSELLEELSYPDTDPPAWDEIDPPGPQTAVAMGTIELAGVGEVDVCAMVLPVFWDLAAYLVLREAEAFGPDAVIMNGVAGYRQKLWLELGAVNEAVRLSDGSRRLLPIEEGTPLVPTAPEEETLRGNLAAWAELRGAAEEARRAQADVEENGTAFGDFLTGVAFAGYPRASNTYLCNNTTFTVGYALDHPGEPLRLMEASDPRGDAPVAIDFTPGLEGAEVPRWFMHWPSGLRGSHVEAGAEVLRAVMAAQLKASNATRGTPDMADI